MNRSDDAVADRLELALAAHPLVPFGEVSFLIDGRTIVLMGSVATIDEHAAIYEVIEDFPILDRVDDRIHRPAELKLAA